jgi:predicted nucleotidyltransferase
MNVAAPHRAVSSGLEGDVLVLLAGITRPASGREIAERLGLRSHDGVRKALERLVRQGIVSREGSRSAYLHVLNREHLGAPAVAALASMRAELWRRLRDAVAEWELAPVHASAFGSAARADGNEESDIDVFVVRPDGVSEADPRWIDQVDSLGARIQQWTGNRASIIEQSEESLKEMLVEPDPPPVLTSIARDAIDLAGVPSRRLLGGLNVA